MNKEFATEHLGYCNHIECKFCVDSACCFGFRDFGCVILDPDLLRRIDKISSFMISANKSFYNNVKFSNRDVPHSIKEIEKGIIDMIKPLDHPF
ncbi:hypothetical protein KAU33_02605 [Candidatus Dependentiae bacterium]|nr:hypothetical protein [Candidatus Dependentiae bacterium]